VHYPFLYYFGVIHKIVGAGWTPYIKKKGFSFINVAKKIS
jgi:hypothetical protein